MQEQQLFNLLFSRDEITWQGMIYDLVRSEEMDPWDVDVTILAKKFLQQLKKMKEMDLRISGKVILASAILLKLKADKLMDEDINGLDSLIASLNAPEDEMMYEELGEYESGGLGFDPEEKPKIFPRTPQPRKRKVSVFDLVNALEKALEVHARRKPVERLKDDGFKAPVKSRDISLVIKDVYNQINDFFSKNMKKARLTFTNLLPTEDKLDKVYTFVPLLHLDNQRKIDLLQEHHFGEIEIRLLDKKEAATV